jgi:hypothetical protein
MMGIDTTVAFEDHVRSKLEDSFGKAVAMLIVASATTSANVPTADLTIGEYHRLVEAICCDQRVVDMWGDAGVQQARQEWERLV